MNDTAAPTPAQMSHRHWPDKTIRCTCLSCDEVDSLRAQLSAATAERDGWKLRSDHKSDLAREHWEKLQRAEAELSTALDMLATSKAYGREQAEKGRCCS